MCWQSSTRFPVWSYSTCEGRTFSSKSANRCLLCLLYSYVVRRGIKITKENCCLFNEDSGVLVLLAKDDINIIITACTWFISQHVHKRSWTHTLFKWYGMVFHKKPKKKWLFSPQALWKTLRNPHDSIAHVAFRVLGKFGGGNRRMLKEPQKVGVLSLAVNPTKNP